MRRCQLKKLWGLLKELQQMAPVRDALLLKLELPELRPQIDGRRAKFD
jgi:hypothetical protein